MDLSEVFGESVPSRAAALPIAPPPAPAAQPAPAVLHEYANGAVLARFVEPHTLPRSSFEAALLRTVQQLKAAAPAQQPGGVTTVDAASLAAHLAGAGYAARVVAGGRNGSATLSLKHTFVTVDRDGDGRLVELIVEPHLRSHFMISRPSPLYSGFIDDLPDEFVGDAERLRALCSFIGDQMGTSFHQNGLTMPPWRNVHSLLSKWNLGQDRSRSPELARRGPPPKPPTFARRSSAGAAVAPAVVAAQLQRSSAGWVTR